MRAHILVGFIAALVAAAGPAQAQPRQSQNGLRAFLQQHLAREDPSAYREARYSAALVDLNGDRRDEALVYLSGPTVCGSGGCDLLILTRGRSGWRVVSEASITNPPVRVLSTRTRGWRDIGVYVRGGGIVRGYEARLRFDGRAYASNPSMVRPSGRRATGRVLITDADRGRPLFP